MCRPALPLLLAVLTAAPAAGGDAPPAPVGVRVADFTLADATTGKPWALADRTRDAKATVVVFLGTGCPVSNAYAPKLTELSKRFAGDGVVFVGVNSFATDDAADVAKHARDHAIPFPVLKDDRTAVADKFAVERAPTAYVLDAGRTVRYKGRIDDQFTPGVQRAGATTRELAAAVNAVVDGREVPTPYAAPAGCLLTRVKTAPAGPAGAEQVTYHKQVSRIVQAKCQECHRPGEAAPFTLMSYADAAGWADMIREVVSDGVMPPWHADAPMGHFRNDRRLTDEQKKTLLAWLDQGCPEGDPKDGPPAKTYVTGWRLGREPDVVLKMSKPVQVPASAPGWLGGMPYQYVPVGEPFKEDTWVTAVEVRPDLRAAIHHIIAFLIPPGGNLRDVANENFPRHVLGAYVPGDAPLIGEPGMAKLLPKGSRILFEVHYTPNGKAGTDQSSIGLLVTTAPPTMEVKSDGAFNPRFQIPPGAANHPVTATMTFVKPATLLALAPHMHLRGKAFKYELVDAATGKTETLLTVPKYDFNWQLTYELATPRKVPAGSVLNCTAWYDNSKGNPFNPDPAKKVRWGNQTWDEMMIGFVEFYEDRAGKK